MQPDIRTFELNDVMEPLAREFAYFAQKRGLKLRIFASRRMVSSDPLDAAPHPAEPARQRLALYLAWRRAGRGAACAATMCWCRSATPDPAFPRTGARRCSRNSSASTATFAGQTGFGLGLAIVRRFAQALNHQVSLASNIGRGSTFSVLLPLSDEAPPPPAPIPPLRPYATRISGAKILLIENEPAVSEAMILLLERWGCDVAAATSGAEAVEKVRALANPPQIIIADLHLNNGELGPQAIEAVRRACGQNVPALLVTADHFATAEEMARRHGSKCCANRCARPNCARCCPSC